MDTLPPARLLTTAEVAEQLRVHENTVYLLVQDGKLRGLKVGRLRRYRQRDVDAYIDAALDSAA